MFCLLPFSHSSSIAGTFVMYHGFFFPLTLTKGLFLFFIIIEIWLHASEL